MGFSFSNVIPSIISAYIAKQPVQIVVPMTGVTLTYDVSDLPTQDAAINMVRCKLLYYLTTLRSVKFTNSTKQYAFTSLASLKGLIDFNNAENLAVYVADKEITVPSKQTFQQP